MKRDPGITDPGQYWALSNFLRGYLHQDAAVEYGSAIGAAQAFRRDADERETAVVHSELEYLLSLSEGVSDADLFNNLAALGSAWRFASRKEVEELRDALK